MSWTVQGVALAPLAFEKQLVGMSPCVHRFSPVYGQVALKIA